jgi:hypothetical protein
MDHSIGVLSGAEVVAIAKPDMLAILRDHPVLGDARR